MSGTLPHLLPSRRDFDGLAGRGWMADLTAGVTVAIVALPLALAFGVASGVGATAGMITAVVAGAVAAVFGGSSLQVSGPTGAMTVVLIPIVASRGVGVVPTIAVMAGVVIAVAGVLRLGRLVTLLPWPVIEGFTFGIAVVIAAQQVPSALGVAKPPGANVGVVAARAVARFADHPDLAVLGLLGVAIALTAVVPRLHRTLPASLIAVVATTSLAGLTGAHVSRLGSLPSRLPAPSMPPLAHLAGLVSPALVVATLAALESLLSARVADGMSDRPPGDPDRELFGQGLANVASGLFGGLPATGALARTAVNARSGARTRLAALVHALVLAALMASAASLVGKIPLVALAGVLIVTAWRMVERRTVRSVLRSSKSDAAVFVLTGAGTIAFDLVTAIEIGVGVAVVAVLAKLARTAQLVPDESLFELADAEEHALLRAHVLVYRLDGPLFFGAAGRFLAELTAVTDVRVVVLRLGNLVLLDATGARAIGEIITQLADRHVAVLLKVTDPVHLRLLRAVGALDALDGTGHVLPDLTSALAHARRHVLRTPAGAAHALASVDA
ncbi:MAG: sulfate permease, SulP family [Frankiales bacterium]|nr:sulfate permease, SulP family [Frankiales bacterium]